MAKPNRNYEPVFKQKIIRFVLDSVIHSIVSLLLCAIKRSHFGMAGFPLAWNLRTVMVLRLLKLNTIL